MNKQSLEVLAAIKQQLEAKEKQQITTAGSSADEQTPRTGDGPGEQKP